jgi:uncharacterized protein (TIGR00730 family)
MPTRPDTEQMAPGSVSPTEGKSRVRRVALFCGSRRGANPLFVEAAEQMGRSIARRGLGLVYGGGSIGLMNVAADAALESGGEVIGVIPRTMAELEIAHPGLSQLLIVESMHERKAAMSDVSDAFAALPGGFGTFEEFCEVVTWAQLGLHDKPCGILNVAGYYDPLLALFDRAVEQGFLTAECRALVLEERDVERLLDRFQAYRPPLVSSKIDRSQS